MNKGWILLVLGLLWALPLSAAEVETIPMAEAVYQALDHAPTFQAARSDRNAAAEDASIGRAAILPRIAAHGSYSQKNQDLTLDTPNNFMKPVISNRESVYGITLFQPLFDMESWAAYRQGGVASDAGEIRLKMMKQQTMLLAASAWLDVMRAKASFLSAQAGETAMNRLALQAQSAFDVGTVSINESLAANSRRDLARSGLIFASQLLRNAESQLGSLLGKHAMTTVPIRQQHLSPLLVSPGDEIYWLDLAETASLEVQLQQKALDLEELSGMRVKGSAAPKLNLVAGYQHNRSSDGSFGGSTTDASSIGIELSVPIFAGGATWAALRKSEHQQLSAEYALQEARRLSRLNAQRAWLSLQSTASEIEALAMAVTSATTEKKAAENGYQVGLRTIVEALDAEERLASARQRYADALARHAMAYLQLHAAVGRLNDQVFEELNLWLHE